MDVVTVLLRDHVAHGQAKDYVPLLGGNLLEKKSICFAGITLHFKIVLFKHDISTQETT